MSTDDALQSAVAARLLLLLPPLVVVVLLPFPLLLLQLPFGGSNLAGSDCGSTRLLLPGRGGATTQLASSPVAAIDVLDNGRRLDVLSIVSRARRLECRATVASFMAYKALSLLCTTATAAVLLAVQCGCRMCGAIRGSSVLCEAVSKRSTTYHYVRKYKNHLSSNPKIKRSLYFVQS